MSKKLYVGNLPYSATESDVTGLFSDHGGVISIAMITDRLTGKFRGFCFVEMEDGEAEKAEVALHQSDFQGRQLVVNAARPRAASGGFRPRSGPTAAGRKSKAGGKKKKGSRRRRRSNFDLF